MSEASQIQLQTSNILNVPLQIYEKDFTFIVNNEKFNTSRIISDLLSPKISSIHQLNPTLSSFTITTNSKGDFSHILELATFSKREIAENEIGFFSEVIEQLGNEDIFIKKKIRRKYKYNGRKCYFTSSTSFKMFNFLQKRN